VQREKAKEETRALLQDILTQHDVQTEKDVLDGECEKEKEVNTKKKKKKSINVNGDKSDDNAVNSSVKENVNTTVSISITGNIDVDDFIPVPQKQSKEFTTSFSLSNNHEKIDTTPSTKEDNKTKVKLVSSKKQKEQDNPWMISSTDDNAAVSKDDDVLQDAITPTHINNHNPTPKKDKPLKSFTQDELIQKAFAQPEEPDFDPDMEEEFANEKNELEEKRKRKKVNKDKKGWGSWAGEGISKKRLKKEKEEPKKQKPQSKNNHVMINQNAISKKCKHQIVNTIPYPFTSLEEYEHSMLGTVGKEWNVHSGVQSMTQEEIKTRNGRIITPLSKQWKLKKGQQQAIHRQQRRNL